MQKKNVWAEGGGGGIAGWGGGGIGVVKIQQLIK